jgi:hypothetical protein
MIRDFATILTAIFIFPFATWMSGTLDKYPELVFPLMLIWLAVIGRDLHRPEWQSKYARLTYYPQLKQTPARRGVRVAKKQSTASFRG